MDIVLYVGLVALAAAIPLVVVGTARTRTLQTAQRAAVRYLGQEGFVSAAETKGGTRSRLMARLGQRLTPKGYTDGLRTLLVRAHSDRTPEQILAAKGLAAAAGVTVALLTAAAEPTLGPLLGAIVGSIGFFLPDVGLRRRANRRSEAIRRALPEALDLMAISVEAGVGLEGAMRRAADDIAGPLGEEFGWVLHDMQLGSSRREAFQALRQRVDVPELSAFLLALLQADALGVAIGTVLKTQAEEMRRKRRQRARERAAKMPVKILFPLVFGIFPALLIVILGPAVIRIMSSFLSR